MPTDATMLDYYRKQVQMLRPLHVTILPGQDDLHIWAPVAGFDDAMLGDVYSHLGNLDQCLRALTARRADIEFFGGIADRHAAPFVEARRMVAFGGYRRGLGIKVVLHPDQSFKALTALLTELEDAGWIVTGQTDEPDLGWRTYKLGKDGREAFVSADLGYHERTNGCRIVPTGETKPVLKIVCEDDAA